MMHFVFGSLQVGLQASEDGSEIEKQHVPGLPKATGEAKDGELRVPLSSCQTETAFSQVRNRPNYLQMWYFMGFTPPPHRACVCVCVCVCVCCSPRGLLNSSLAMKTYAQRLHLLLHLEEIQTEVDIRKYDLRNQVFTRDQCNKKLLTFRVS